MHDRYDPRCRRTFAPIRLQLSPIGALRRTMFPVPLGEASSWDPAAVAKDEAVSGDEAAADGIKWTFNPMVDISRDPRWGRVVEGAGEDPFLGSAIAAAKVRGYQGRDFGAPDKVAATIKHFGAYGAPVAGREYNTVDMSTQQLFNDYLPPYKAAVDAGAATVMSSFNSLNGVPNTANPYLLTTILRDEWGFSGTTLSDYQAVQELEDFGYAADGADAARLALTAGVNIEMAVTIGSTPGKPVSPPTRPPGRLLGSGKITMKQLNDAVRHVLTLKYLAGMFSQPESGERHPRRARGAHDRDTWPPRARRPTSRWCCSTTTTPPAARAGAAAQQQHRQGRGGRPAGRRPHRPARARRADRLRPNPSRPRRRRTRTRSSRSETGSPDALRAAAGSRYAQVHATPTPCTDTSGFGAAVGGRAGRRRDRGRGRRAGVGHR